MSSSNRQSSACDPALQGRFASSSGLGVAVGGLTIALTGALAPTSTAYGETIRYTMTGPGPTVDRRYNSVWTAADDAFSPFLGSTAEIATFFPGYTGVQAISMSYNIRGVPWVESFTAGSPILTVSIPSTGALTFSGLTRDASFLLYDAFLDSAAGEEAYRRFLELLVAQSSIDALAGNPGSLQGTLVRGGLDIAAGNSFIERRDRDVRAPGRRTDESSPAWVLGAVGAGYSGGDFSGQRFDGRFERHFGGRREGSRSQLKIDIPFTFNSLEGAPGGSLAIGVGYEMLVTDRWSIEPRASIGGVYQPDISTVGAMSVLSLTSRFRLFSAEKTDVYVGNMIGQSQTHDLFGDQFSNWDEGDLETDGSLERALLAPEISNTVLRNGIAAERVFDQAFLGRRGSVRVSLTNTAFSGTKLSVENFNEAAVSIGVGAPAGQPSRAAESLRIGFGYAFGGDYSSGNVSIGWRF